MKDIITLYIKDSGELVDMLLQSIQSSSSEEINSFAHVLKSNSLSVGGVQLAENLQKLETMGKEGSIDGAEAMFGEIKNLHNCTVSALRDYLQGPAIQ